MGRRATALWWMLAAPHAFVGAQAPAVEAEPPTAVATGAAFRVVCHGGDERIASQALAVVEPVWPRMRELFGAPAAAPDAALVVHLYRTAAAYEAADRALTGGRFLANQAMCHWDSKTAHVALQPPVHDDVLRELGLPLQTQAMLAWEACHVARFELCRNFRLHPGWFLDAVAGTTAQRVLRELHPGLGAQPFFDQRWVRAVRLLDEGALPGVDALLDDATRALGMRDRYAVRIAFGEFVRGGDGATRFEALARELRALAVGSEYRDRARAAAQRAFAGLDDGFRAAVRARAPQWDEVGRSLWCRDDEWVQIAFPAVDAIAWRSEPVVGGGFAARGALRILPGGGHRLDLLFDRRPDGCFVLAFVAGRGVALYEHHVESGERRLLAEAAAAALTVGREVPFVVRVEGRELRVELAGEACAFVLPRPLSDEVVWGLGARAASPAAATGSAGIWKGLQVLPL